MSEQMNQTPVKVYCSSRRDRITIAAPFPGLEPQDIRAEITAGGMLTIDGRMRGLLKGDKEVLRDEWNPGPYRCNIQLEMPVDGPMANITYENGVVVISLPAADAFRPAELTLERIHRAEGRRIGNAGHPVKPMTAEQHYQIRAMQRHAATLGLEVHH